MPCVIYTQYSLLCLSGVPMTLPENTTPGDRTCTFTSAHLRPFRSFGAYFCAVRSKASAAKSFTSTYCATPLTAAANAITKIATNFFICFLSFLCD